MTSMDQVRGALEARPVVGPWQISTGRSFRGGTFWSLWRLNPAWMYGQEWALNTSRNQRRWYSFAAVEAFLVCDARAITGTDGRGEAQT